MEIPRHKFSCEADECRWYSHWCKYHLDGPTRAHIHMWSCGALDGPDAYGVGHYGGMEYVA